MRSSIRAVLIAGVGLAVLACSSNSATGTNATPTYADISGSFSGPVTGTSQGYTLSQTLSLTIAQSDGSLSGTYSAVGTLSLGTQSSAFTSTGTFTGTIASGNNPSVNIVVPGGDCPGSSQFSGSYDSANHRLTITGPFSFTSAGTCTVVVTFQVTLILNK